MSCTVEKVKTIRHSIAIFQDLVALLLSIAITTVTFDNHCTISNGNLIYGFVVVKTSYMIVSPGPNIYVGLHV